MLPRVKSGFTLVEMLVIAPLIILLVGAVVSSTIYAVNSAIRSQAKSQLQLDVLSALDRIEQDVLLSVDTMSVPVTGGNSQVIMTNLATNENPLSTSRKLIRRSGCSVPTGGIPIEEALRYQTAYKIASGGTSLVRELSRTECASASTVWQKNNSTETLLTGAKSVSMSATLSTPSNLSVALTVVRTSGGRDISYTGYLYAKSTNIK